ncbi:MAG: hypothetical protein KatS3mg034_0820 [Vicingaceae bacterium]|nr:MAG: hypothetical protein KatS3mg034_0820 [Vicingaceae bacterium]
MGIKNFSIIILLFACQAFAQTDEVKLPPIFASQLTFAPANFWNIDSRPIYLHGSMQLFLKNQKAFSGEAFYYIGEPNTDKFMFHHMLFFGINFYKVKGISYWYAGLQPGLSYTAVNPFPFSREYTAGINPLFSVNFGGQFFIYRFMHFFVQIRTIMGQHSFDRPISLFQSVFSAGLGFNLMSNNSRGANRSQ